MNVPATNLGMLGMAGKTETLELRPYQDEALVQSRIYMRQHRRFVLYLPTGAGKTEIAVKIMELAKEKGHRTAFLVDRTSLVDQTSQRLSKYGIKHDILQADNTTYGSHNITVVSKQTLEKRELDISGYDLLIDDECHDMREYMVKQIKKYEPRLIGLSASPFSAGLGRVYNAVLSPIVTNELVKKEFLVPLKVFSGVPIEMPSQSQEWSSAEVERRTTRPIVGDIVQHWVKRTHELFGGPAKTLVFSATVDSGTILMEEWNRLGYRFEQVSYKLSEQHNLRIINKFKDPDSDIVGIINSEMLVKGSDVPHAQILVDARPYKKSFKSVVQKFGRIMRPYPGKEHGVIFDHAGNFTGFRENLEKLFKSGVRSLSEFEKKFKRDESKKARKESVCDCGYVFQPQENICPSCGAERKRPKRRDVEYVAGRMQKMDFKQKAVKKEFSNKQQIWQELGALAAEKPRFENDPDKMRKWMLAKYRHIYDEWPPKAWGFDIAQVEVSTPLRNKVRSSDIRYAKRIEKEKAQALLDEQ